MDLDEAREHVLVGMQQLPVHPDVPDGLRRLRAGGSRLATLSNGATSVADALLRRAGARDEMEHLLSVEDAGAWKPAAEAYRWAAGRCGVALDDAMLVAVHPVDIDGAARAGARTAWSDRRGGPYPAYFAAPDLTASSLTELADMLG